MDTTKTQIPRRLAQWLAACLLLGASVAQGAPARTLVYCSEAAPSGWNPQLFAHGSTLDASAAPLFNRLVDFKLGGSDIIPSLAQSWSISPDGLIYTFHLRRDVAFHRTAHFTPTRNLNADDVLLSFERQMNANHPMHPLPEGLDYIWFSDLGMQDILQSVRKLDDYTVQFRLKRSEAAFLADLAMPWASILSAQYAQAMREAGTPRLFDEEPVGTGPFVLVSYQLNESIRYKAFDAYFNGKPHIDQLIYAITPDAAVRIQRLRAGECHIAVPRPIDLDIIRSDPALRLLWLPGLNVGYVAFDVRKAPMNDRRVRQAMAYATDRNAIVRTVFRNTAVLARKGEYLAAMFGWTGDNADPDNFLTPIMGCSAAQGGGNPSYWCDERFQQLIASASSQASKARRTALYHQAQAILNEEMPLLPIAHATAYVAIRKEVQGYRMDMMSRQYFDKVQLRP